MKNIHKAILSTAIAVATIIKIIQLFDNLITIVENGCNHNIKPVAIN